MHRVALSDQREEFVDGLEQYQARLRAGNRGRSTNLSFCRKQFLSFLRDRMVDEALQRTGGGLWLTDSWEKSRCIDPYSAVEEVLKKVGLAAS